MGGPPGLDGPPGEEQGPPQQPIAVSEIPVADAWKILEKIAKGEQYSKFFEQISIIKPKKPSEMYRKNPEDGKEKRKSSLLR
jgi:hypothetical protein